jgi:hypothetical protein
MQRNTLTAIALMFATSFAPACGTRTGFAVAGGTLATGIVMYAAGDRDYHDPESGFRPTDVIVGNLLILAGAGMLFGNLVAATSQSTKKPVRAVPASGRPSASAQPVHGTLAATDALMREVDSAFVAATVVHPVR